jgi:rhamnulokinase
MSEYFLAVDIGASSGRHILGHLEHGHLITEEIHRFENEIRDINGALCWDLSTLFEEIKLGMKKCLDNDKIPYSIGIDTWAVDFVLLDRNEKVLGNAVAYRDSRTKGMDDKVYSIISEDKLYARTGIQKQIFNSIYQLMAVKEHHSEYLEDAESFLMIPDYIHYLLSGVKSCEYTNATTSQLMNPMTKEWDRELITMLGYPEKIFPQIACPGNTLGYLTKEMQEEVGYNCKVILPATHDTGSAVIAIPSEYDNPLYISSGTWSLMGTELRDAICTNDSRRMNFTNEGGYNHRFRYLKNIMGLWMIQSVKREIGKDYSFSELCEMASQKKISSMVDCNDSRFLAPSNMVLEVQKACGENNQQIPIGIGEVAAVIYNSLAECYKKTVFELEKLTNLTFDCIHVVGGGANAEYLNQLTATATGKKVCAGPSEATAIGNILAQMISAGELEDLTSARKCVKQSIDLKVYNNKLNSNNQAEVSYDDEGTI